jgi:hypothetical protein
LSGNLWCEIRGDARLDVIGTLTRPEFNHATIGEAVRAEWVLADNGFYST